MHKKGYLRVVASTFNPLRFISSFVVSGKALSEELWRLKIQQDHLLGKIIQPHWNEWLDDLSKLIYILPCFLLQCFRYPVTMRQVFLLKTDRRHCSFVTSETRLAPMKTKLVPVKTISLPKLLLNVAVLEIRLDRVIIKEVHLIIQNITFWTDSVLVLQYIRNGFKIHFTKQVTEIKEETLLNNDAT